MKINAPDAEAERRRFRVTHPFHQPLGHGYDLIQLRHFWAEDRVVHVDEAGEAHSLPARWTSAVADDLGNVFLTGEPRFSAKLHRPRPARCRIASPDPNSKQN